MRFMFLWLNARFSSEMRFQIARMSTMLNKYYSANVIQLQGSHYDSPPAYSGFVGCPRMIAWIMRKVKPRKIMPKRYGGTM